MAIDDILSTTGTEGLSADDRLRLCQWNHKIPTSVYRCVHDLIHERTQCQPQAAAVCASDGEWTYQQLDSVSSRLAQLLRSRHQIIPEQFVPICATKSCWTPVAMLAVMKAGGAFVLVDPSHPPARLRLIAQRVSASVVLTSASCVSVASQMAAQWIVLEGTGASLEYPSPSNLAGVATPENAMYVVFTSGSTGTPKGAVMTHMAYASSATSVLAPFQLGPQSRVLQFASYAFDVSISDHLLTLVAGGCICIPPPGERDLSKAITTQQVNWACLTPSIARTLRPARVPSLRHLVVAGEAVTQTDVDTWTPSATTLINGYGPAEYAIIISIQSPVSSKTPPACIGKQCAARCWVVDAEDHNQLVPPGTVGELIVEGPALSRGYIKNPEQTARAFIDTPRWLRRSEGWMFYKTGDLVYLQSDGRLHYEGRKDTMVKIRGQRIELGEVEHHVRHCGSPWVKDVVAEVVAGTRTTAQLTVFILSSEAEADVSSSTSLFVPSCPERFHELQTSLRQRVPPYMVPTEMLQVSLIPHTLTGKSDRRRLREEAAIFWRTQRHCKDSSSHGDVFTTPNEKALRDLWADVLDLSLQQIGREDDWLSLGGDSLLAMMLVDRARDSGLIINIRDIFQHRRLRDLAETMGQSSETLPDTFSAMSMLPDGPEERQAVLDAIKPGAGDGEIEDIYPCLALQSWFCNMSIAEGANWTAHIDVALPPNLSEERLSSSWRAVIEAHPMLRTQIVQAAHSDQFWQVVYTKAPRFQILHDGEAYPPRQHDLWGLNQPLARLYKQGNTLRLLIHHTLWDMHALTLVFEQLARAYEGATLTSRPVQPLIQWALHAGHNFAAAEFWRRSLTGLPAPKFPPYPSDNYQASATAISATHKVCVQRGVGSFTVDSHLRLALAVVLARASQENTVVFGAAVARRAAPVIGVMELVAPLTTMQLVPVRLDPEQRVSDALQAVQDQAITAASFPDADFGSIMELGSEISEAATNIRTLIEVQPSPSMFIPPVLANLSLHDNGTTHWALLVECDYRAEYTNVLARYDPQLLSTAQVNGMLKQFARVAELTQTEPETRLSAVLSEAGDKWE
ncbi:hypothetical protein BJX99DRAFT_263216 [Aspergillus californicus]